VLAILRQDLDLVRAMVENGADLDARDRSGSTALMWAAFNETGDARIVEALLQWGRGSINKRSESSTASMKYSDGVPDVERGKRLGRHRARRA
jgi:ankyrin repeat protein